MTTVQLVPIEKIRVINARGRSKAKFREIVENIAKICLKKPITVSRREGDDGFDLVCGQGRLEAYIAYGAREIPAVVVDIPLEDRLLCSLVEPGPILRTEVSLRLGREGGLLHKPSIGAGACHQLSTQDFQDWIFLDQARGSC